jgi:hypothetical protein
MANANEPQPIRGKLSFFLCEAPGCAELATHEWDRGYRVDIYCTKHAEEEMAKALQAEQE